MSTKGDKSEKSKAQLRAERREKQEAQRAAKVDKKPEKKQETQGLTTEKPLKHSSAIPAVQNQKRNEEPRNQVVSQPNHIKDVQMTASTDVKQHTVEKRRLDSTSSSRDRQSAHGGSTSRRAGDTLDNKVPHVSLSEGHSSTGSEYVLGSMPTTSSNLAGVHSAFSSLRNRLQERTLRGSDDQCTGLISAFKDVIDTFITPPKQSFGRALQDAIKPSISFLSEGHALPVCMGNIVKQLKYQINQLSDENTEKQGKETLIEWLDSFSERIQFARTAIYKFLKKKLQEARTVMIYGHSSLVLDVLLKAKGDNLDLEVIVVDSFPHCSGKDNLRTLMDAGIPCTFVLLPALPFVIHDTELILMGADGVLANGNVLSAVGSAQIAISAKFHLKPLIVVCPTYKFSDKVLTGTIDTAHGGQSFQPSLEMIDQSLVSAIVCEERIAPCYAVPAILSKKGLQTVVD